ncbi:Por secretion system C-terminal sorting domain-containing protein [Dyadobacter soli]|uniref:Por secretion system C-terminal sorting domain-containing protein n=1 Tax=Dyadobacter soli TaxID=659014 RepID=A0A1G7CXQ8_9BACT|nr:FG-GAP-like repeat-containing protein [Dyadobacter soli]SDE44097.1 Por secretion system C-terminal sorting domain-containing protein [Dyadobacter soli]
MKNHYKFLIVSLLAFGLLFYKKIDKTLPVINSAAPKTQAKSTADDAPLIPDSTLSGIRQVITSHEYHVSYDKKAGVLQSPNRKQNLRAMYAPGALTLQKRVDSTHSDFKLKLLNQGVFADGELLYAVSQESKVNSSENKVVINHGRFSEEFINNEDGVRQNFIIESAPAGVKSLAVKLTVSGAEVLDKGKNELRFITKVINGSSEELVYNGLKCWDANGQILDATLAFADNQIEITTDVANAAFPVTIDPIVGGGPAVADKRLEIHQNLAWLGYSVSSAGDVNGDGYSDVIIGAPKYDLGQADEGAAFVFPGTDGGLSLAAVTLQSNQANAQAGTSVSSAGDVNKDGYSDVLVGAPFYDSGQNDEGVAFLYLGSAAGINTNPAKTLQINQTTAGFGISVAMAGDVNGDGHSDILVGAHQYDNGENNEGAAFLYYGNATDVNVAPVTLESNKANSMMGYAVSSAGDINADGYSDVLVGARLYSNGELYEGAVFVYKGSVAGIVTANPFKVESNQADARLGHSVATVGDVNGDGFADVLLGAYQYKQSQTHEGAAFLYFGSTNGEPIGDKRMFLGYQKEGQFGWAVAGAGDVNGDGYADFMVGARYYQVTQPNEGAVFLYYGNHTKNFPIRNAVFTGDQGDAWLGSAVASAGDVNGDGYSDIVIGAYAYNNGQTDEGTALIFHGGGLTGHTTAKNAVPDSVSGRRMGSAVANAGDINADGFDDIIVTAPGIDQFTSGRTCIVYGSAEGIRPPWYNMPQKLVTIPFGRSVAAAGDVNGDGYADVVIGNPSPTNALNGGEVRVYFGAAAGIDTINFQVMKEPLGGTMYGIAVGGAGDLNGDNYADVVVGATKYKVGNEIRGAAYVYYGSGTGLGVVPKILPGKHNNASMGASVSGLGDTNGDGFGDLIVGAPTANTIATQGGSAWIYYGSLTGVENSNTYFKNDNAYVHFGTSVAAAGDVNGDGFNDAVIGLPGHGLSKQGSVAVYLGASGGFTEANKRFYPGNWANAAFGISVASAGDVNGDGYSDIIAGENKLSHQAAQRGGFTVIPGVRHGGTVPANWEEMGSATLDQMGTSVSGGGDVNGDGFSDIIVGIPGRDGINSDVGGVQIFDGGAEYQDPIWFNVVQGKPGRLKLYNTDLIAPYAPSAVQPNFGIGLKSRSFLGRNKGKLVWETKGKGQPFSSSPNRPISNSVASTGSQAAFIDLTAGGTELKSQVLKLMPETKVRARVRFDPALALTGQMYGPWRYVQVYVAGKSVSPPPAEETESNLRLQAEFEENEEELVSIFPNPASEKLFIRSNAVNAVKSLKLISASGAVVYQAGHAQSEIDLKGMAPGMYILVSKHADGSQLSHKVMVKK